MKIASIKFGSRPLFLAPMEDVSDPPFRVLCKRFGADLLYTEFISSAGLVRQIEDAIKKLDFRPQERPIAVQIFGGEIDQVRNSVKTVNQVKPDIIDINFGCPVRKIVCREAGAGILQNLPKMQALTEAVVAEADSPVTVKTRLGWDDDSIRVLEVARLLEAAGVKALAVHARTRSQMYRGNARWDWLKRLKLESGIRIPLIGNGDATSPELIKAMFDKTGVDAVMVGRGAIGNPWIFRDAKWYLETGELLPPPEWEERLALVAEHLTLKCDWLGERVGVLEMRRMYGGYFRGIRNSSRLRKLLMKETRKDRVLEVLLNFRQQDSELQTTVPPSAIAKALHG